MKSFIFIIFLFYLIPINSKEISIPICLTENSKIGITYSNSDYDYEVMILLNEKLSTFSNTKNIYKDDHEPLLISEINEKKLRVLIENLLKEITPLYEEDNHTSESINIVIGKSDTISFNFNISKNSKPNLLLLKNLFLKLEASK